MKVIRFYLEWYRRPDWSIGYINWLQVLLLNLFIYNK